MTYDFDYGIVWKKKEILQPYLTNQKKCYIFQMCIYLPSSPIYTYIHRLIHCESFLKSRDVDEIQIHKILINILVIPPTKKALYCKHVWYLKLDPFTTFRVLSWSYMTRVWDDTNFDKTKMNLMSDGPLGPLFQH